MNAYRAEVEALVRRVVPDEMDNVDDIMVQFSGREEELIETLRSMQEKSIAQRARAAVQRSAKPDLRDISKRRDDDSEDLGHSEASFTEGGDAYTDGGDHSMTTDGHSEMPSSKGSYASGSSSPGNSVSPDESHSIRDSITNEYTEGEDDEYSTSYTRSEYESRSDRSSDSTSVSSYTSGSGDSSASRSSGEDSSPSILSELGDSIGIISVGKTAQGDDMVKASPGLGEAIDASDWQAVGEAATQLRGGTDGYQSQESSKPHSLRSVMTGMSTDTNDELDGMIDAGNWEGIIDAASNMTTGHNSSEEVMDSVLDGLD